MKYLSISTSTLGKLRKYLSKVQVLSSLYLVYLSISTHVLGPMSAHNDAKVHQSTYFTSHELHNYKVVNMLIEL